jgi:hypothetical protein
MKRERRQRYMALLKNLLLGTGRVKLDVTQMARDEIFFFG